jgi:hypothetical protein
MERPNTAVVAPITIIQNEGVPRARLIGQLTEV